MRVVMTFYYLVALGTGLVTLALPPLSVLSEVGRPLTFIWSAFLLIGGLGGALTVYTTQWKLERLSIYSVLVGVFLYESIVIYLQFSSEGFRFTQMGFLLLALVAPVLRLSWIWKYDVEPVGE